MAEEYTPLDFQISDAELEQLPPLALRLIIRKLLDHSARQDQRIRELEAEVSQLKARLDQNSSNSNKPPSSDSPYQNTTPKPVKKKSGGRKGHKGHRQELITPTRTELIHPGPCTCGCQTFTAVRPYHTHQHIELPEIAMTVIHFVLHRGKCANCGKTGKGYTPKTFQTGFGPRLCALVAEIGGIEGNSRQAVQSFCSSVLGFSISLGAIQNIIDRVSKATLPHYEAIRDKARTVAVNHVDETPWKNSGKLNWLWVMANSVVALFMVHTNRSKVAFEALVGGWEGILVSDGYRLYQNWVHARQSCLAHLIRRAKGLAERKEPELARCGAWARDELRRLCKMAKDPPTKAEWNAFYARFNRLIALYIDSDSEAGKLVRHLDTEMGSLFTFLLEEGVDPTNNFGERMLRHAVLWRKRSQGTNSDKGNRWVERIVSLRQTCRLQGKSSFHVLVAAMDAFFKDQQPDLEWIRSAT
ncbi:MAG TPA: IS66 family transposase [Levilinea sp.]|nr:IS66 family transposase [Levilinea sp.]